MASPIFAAAARQYHACRREYGDHLEDVFSRASDDCNGVLMNARGQRQGVDPFSLFSGNEVRALAYASEELVEWWAKHPRMTFTAFEQQWFELPLDTEPIDL